MTRIALIILISIIPFLTLAQKRGKSKKNNNKIENTNNYEFMIIIGQLFSEGREVSYPGNDGKVIIYFDFGAKNSEDNIALSKKKYRSMADAVNNAATYGWDFINANIVSDRNNIRTHYYHMRRNQQQ